MALKITYSQIESQLKKKEYSPVYFLMGEETFFIDKITDYIAQNVLSESEKAFNQVVMYGKDIDAAAVVTAAKRFPMMAPYQVIIVKEAQEIKDIENLVYYTDTPLNSTILVINYKYKKIDKRKKLYKSLEKNGVLFESNKLYDNKVPDWIHSYLKENNFTIQPPAALLLTENIGNDLAKMSSALEKLMLLIPEGVNTITTSHIEENIGISKEFNTLELQKAIATKDALKAYRIVDYFGANPNKNPIVLTLTSFYFFFSKVLTIHSLSDKSKNSVAAALKINPYFVGEYMTAARSFNRLRTEKAISLLREYDLKSKGIGNVSASHHELLKELVSKLLY